MATQYSGANPIADTSTNLQDPSKLYYVPSTKGVEYFRYNADGTKNTFTKTEGESIDAVYNYFGVTRPMDVNYDQSGSQDLVANAIQIPASNYAQANNLSYDPKTGIIGTNAANPEREGANVVRYDASGNKVTYSPQDVAEGQLNTLPSNSTSRPKTSQTSLPSSFSERLSLAQEAGINNYTGTSSQNAQIRAYLEQQQQTQDEENKSSTGANRGQNGASTVVAPPYIGPTLQQGSNGPDVSKLQSALSSYGLTVDGQFGPKTLAAVKAFQASKGLVADGIVGPKTWAALAGTTTNPLSSVSAGLTTPSPNQVDETTGEKIGSKLPSTGDPTIDTLMERLQNSAPQVQWSEVYKKVVKDSDLGDMQSSFETNNDELTKLLDKKNDEAQDINNNPWYTEGERVKRLEQLDKRYEGKTLILQNKMSLLQTQIDNAREDAKYITGQVMAQVNANAQLQQDVILKSIEIAEAQIAAENKLGLDLQQLALDTYEAQTARMNKTGTVSSSGISTGSSISSSKEDIMAIQRQLNENGAGLVVDGIMGPKTQAAMESAGIPVSKSDPFVELLLNSAGGKRLTDTSVQKLDKAFGVLDQLGVLQNNIKNMATGPLVGAFRAANPWDTNAQVIKAQLNAIVPNLARGVYGEVGVLTDNDIKQYAKTLPTLTSTEDIRNAVLAITVDMVGKSLKRTLEVNAANKADVSGYVDLYKSILSQRDALFDSINSGTSTTSQPTQDIWGSIGNFLWGSD